MPSNPYQYSGNGQGFLTDYSGFDAAGSAFKGFADAYASAQDRQMKRQEQQAQIEALRTKMEREQDQTDIDLIKQGIRKGPSGFEEAPLSPREKSANQLKAITGGARESEFTDEAGNPIYEPNPDYWRIQNVHNQQGNKDRVFDLQQKKFGLQQVKFGEQQSQNAIKAGQAFDNDELIKKYQISKDGLDRARGLLHGKVPLTAKNLAIVQQDVIDAMTKGSQSSEGKVNREMQDVFVGKWNNLMAEVGNFGENNDIRTQAPGLAKQIGGLIEEVDAAVSKNMDARYARLKGTYGQSSNQKLNRTVDEKTKGLVAPGLVGGGMVKEAAPSAPAEPQAKAQDPKITQFAKSSNIDYQTAEKILKARGYGAK